MTSWSSTRRRRTGRRLHRPLWLLSPALLATSLGVPSPASSESFFTDVAASLGIADTNLDSLGACWADYDSDGDLDVFVANSGRSNTTGRGRSRLWQNNGGTFLDRAGITGVRDALAAPLGCAWADIDDDGDPDLVVAQKRPPDPTIATSVFENTGGTFVNRTAESGISRGDQGDASVDIADVDNDGLLDVVVAARFSQDGVNGVYVQTGPFTFVDVAAETGLANPKGPDNTFAIGMQDVDLDGDLDALLINDFWGVDLFRRDGAVYTRVTEDTFPAPATAGGADPDNPMGVGWGDYDLDGNVDIIIPGMDMGTTPDLRTLLYRGNGDGTFSDVTDAAGLTMTGNVHWNGQFADIDNDGDKDISITSGAPDAVGDAGAQPNVVWVNQLMETGSPTFVDRTSELGLLSVGTSRSGAWADYDGDGRLDFFLTGRRTPKRLFRNDGPTGAALMVRPLTEGGSLATGTWVRAKVGPGILADAQLCGAPHLAGFCSGSGYLYDYVRGLDGYMTQSLTPVHLGLGGATSVEEIWLRRPGTTDWTLACTNVPANSTLTISSTNTCQVGSL